MNIGWNFRREHLRIQQRSHYVISDGVNDVSRSASFEVVSINDIPTLSASPQPLPDGEEDVVYTINANTLLDNYSDVEGNTLSIVSLSAAGGEINETSTGVWEFTPAKDYSGDVKLNYVISDGNNGYAVDDITITLLAVNDLPVRLEGSVNPLTVVEDSGTTSLGLADLLYGPGGGNDELTQKLSYTVTGLPDASIGSVTLSDGTAVTSNTDYSLNELRAMKFNTFTDGFGDTNFSFTVSDDAGAEITETIAIRVEGINEVPELTGTLVTLADGSEDQAYILTASDLLTGYSDRDGDILSVQELNASNGTLLKPIPENHNTSGDKRHRNTRICNTTANCAIGVVDGLRKSCPVVHCVNPFLKTTLKVIIE